MNTSFFALAGLGLLLGFRHAFEPDHLAAVSTLATRQGKLLDACRLGVAWAVGHSLSVGVVVGAIMLFGLQLPRRLWPAADAHAQAVTDRARCVGPRPLHAGALAPARARTRWRSASSSS